mmetsp:Transcript_110061/g.318172  ORF Transcript_110061/g.318172 Transcript_110061/m.318172 type:complete len:410 (+) Transcript_110061:240-1469(+)
MPSKGEPEESSSDPGPCNAFLNRLTSNFRKPSCEQSSANTATSSRRSHSAHPVLETHSTAASMRPCKEASLINCRTQSASSSSWDRSKNCVPPGVELLSIGRGVESTSACGVPRPGGAQATSAEEGTSSAAVCCSAATGGPCARRRERRLSAVSFLEIFAFSIILITEVHKPVSARFLVTGGVLMTRFGPALFSACFFNCSCALSMISCASDSPSASNMSWNMSLASSAASLASCQASRSTCASAMANKAEASAVISSNFSARSLLSFAACSAASPSPSCPYKCDNCSKVAAWLFVSLISPCAAAANNVKLRASSRVAGRGARPLSASSRISIWNTSAIACKPKASPFFSPACKQTWTASFAWLMGASSAAPCAIRTSAVAFSALASPKASPSAFDKRRAWAAEPSASR